MAVPTNPAPYKGNMDNEYIWDSFFRENNLQTTTQPQKETQEVDAQEAACS